MKNSEKIRLLKKARVQSYSFKVHDNEDPEFQTWKNLVERTLIKVFGKNSPEFEQFSKLGFFYSSPIMFVGTDYSREDKEAFETSLKILLNSLDDYIKELMESSEENNLSSESGETESYDKVFISHSSNDKEIVEVLIDLLEDIGLPYNKIFCTSLEPYGVDLGEDFLEKIKDELKGNILVLFVITENFYNSTISICEMGATWVLSNEHIPVLVPPMEFRDIQGVIPHSQGLKIDDASKLNSLKKKIQSFFQLEDIDQSIWDRKRKNFLSRIKKC